MKTRQKQQRRSAAELRIIEAATAADGIFHLHYYIISAVLHNILTIKSYHLTKIQGTKTKTSKPKTT